MNEIEGLREEIDKVDREIVQLLNKRIELVLHIGELKNRDELAVEDLEREKEILSKLCGDKLDGEFLRNIYEVIFRYSKSKQM